MSRTRFQSRVTLAAVVAAMLFALPDAEARRGRGGDDGGGGGGDALTLRVNDAIGVPGGTVAVVLRTYAPRPVRQGQIHIKIRRPPARTKALGLTVEELTQPVRPLTLISATVYSQRGDSVSQAALTGQPDSQTATVRFESPSGSVNASDGPMAVFRFRLAKSVKPGQRFELQVDPAQTSLVDQQGRPVTLEPRPAFLTVRAPKSPFLIEAEGDDAEPGEMAELGVQTQEPFPVSGGRVTLRYDQKLAGGAAVVRMDPRYGRSTFTVDRSKPGVLVVNFTSPDSTLNTVPGTIVAVDLPVAASARIGARSPVTLDPAGTWLLSRKGRKLKIRIENGMLEVE
ncbi:MAG TPA: hypothetical protein VLE27_08345 [Thermoanaerobaculia bacterium]|nr:hypothetical protein [Thermoanaerobaculia bacterium]